MIKKSWGVQLAVILLIASGVAVLSIYASYMVREAKDINTRVKNNTPAGFYVVNEPQPRLNVDVNAHPNARDYRFVGSWHYDNTPTSLGTLPITYLDLTYGDISWAPRTGVAAIHSNLADRLGISVGDLITLNRQSGPVSVEVTDVYTQTPFYHGIDFGEAIVVRTGDVEQNTHFLYTKTGGFRVSDSQVMNSLKLWHTRNSVVFPAHEDNSFGNLVVQSNYSVISQARLTLLMFICLAFLTAKLLGYLDNRRMLAILKALGLKQGQIALAISIESMITPLCGAVAGGAFSVVLLHTLNRTGYNISFSLHMVVTAMLSIFPAVFLGVFVPARLAQVSTVNELLFERPASMFREKTTSLRKRHPALDPYTDRGVHFLRFETVDGAFDGFIFRKLGDKVQAGEVLGIQSSWWGMKTREYVAPISGTVVYYESHTGIVGIGDEELLLPRTDGVTVPLTVNYATPDNGDSA